jgi:uncharacterized protein Yka (UPF0111/DUF47 family)
MVLAFDFFHGCLFQVRRHFETPALQPCGGKVTIRLQKFSPDLRIRPKQVKDLQNGCSQRICVAATSSAIIGNQRQFMFSLQRLLGKEDLFFGLLEASAIEAQNSVHALVKLSQSLDQPVELEAFALARRKDKEITVQIRNAVYTIFVTPLEREDIEALSLVLYRIPKTVEKFGERILLAPQQVKGVDFSKQISLLEQATECVVNLVKSLRAGINLDEVKKWNDRLQQVEGDADKAIVELYRDLFSGRHDALKVIVLKDLYELLEKIIDRCRDVGNVISQIVLKNS